MKLKRSREGIRLELTPLIDVVFLLLVFFVFSLVMMVRADRLDLVLPDIGAGRQASADGAIRISIDAEGEISVDGQRVSQDDLGGFVSDRISEQEGAAVLVSADTNAPAGKLIRVADALIASGVTEFGVLGNPGGGVDREQGTDDAASEPESNLD